jgi:YegS/Rv2252/BmrU family lipid kinase
MQRVFLYFINPISGTVNKKKLLEIISTATKNQQIPFQIMDTLKDGNYSFLPEKIKAEGITDVIICGGDGTINQITSFLLSAPVNIGIIPVGSGNGLALGAGIGVDVNKALSIIFKGKANYIDAFNINDNFGCMLAGLGFDAQVALEFSTQKRRGLIPYVTISLKRFFTSKPYFFEILFDNHTIETEALFISFANSNQFGSRIKIAPQATLNDGLLDVVVVHKNNKLRTALSILKQITTGKIQTKESLSTKENGVSYFHTNELTIINPQLAPLHIDGEPTQSTPTIHVKIIPDAFKLLLP